MKIKEDTVWYYHTMVLRDRNQSMLAKDHHWFPYQKKLNKMLAKISKITGITDFQSLEGQNILSLINNYIDKEKTTDSFKADAYMTYGFR
jgi:hypothetical protein